MANDLFTPGYQFAQYEIVAPLGEGGMGTVWKALHRGLKKLVVVKALKGERARSEQARARFMREGEAASRVRHPHIVEVFDVGEHEGNAYLVMELLEGADLSRHLAQRGALAPEAGGVLWWALGRGGGAPEARRAIVVGPTAGGAFVAVVGAL